MEICEFYVIIGRNISAETSEMYLRTCAPGKTSDLAHSRSLIRIFTGCILDSKGLKKFIMRTMKILIGVRGCAG